MKKYLKIILPILILIIVVVAFFTMYYTIFGNKRQIQSLEITTNNISLEVGDTKDLKDCYLVEPEEANFYVMCYISDESCAEINANNILTAKSVGNTTILLKCKVKNKPFEEEIDLTVTEKQVIPSSFGFEYTSITTGLNSTNCYNNIVCSESYNVVPSIEYSINNVCEYNYNTGLITPISLGTTTVTVKFEKDGEIVSNSFTVNVENNYRSIVPSLSKEGDYFILNLSKNSLQSFTLKTFESGVEDPSIKINFEFNSNEINASILQYELNCVIIKATEVGETILKVSCKDDESIFVNIKLRVS